MDAEKPTTASIEFVCDRQNLIEVTRARRLGLEPVYAMERLDMYRVRVAFGDQYASYSIEPMQDGTWGIRELHGAHSAWTERVAMALFAGSPEEAQQRRWVAALVAGGYFADDFEVAMCPHCDQWFAAGTTHPHRRQGDRILPHSHQRHRALLAAGFQPTWAPAHAEEPSLEELGEL